MSSERYAVHEGRKPRDPRLAVRVVAGDGRAVHVIREDAMKVEHDEPLSLADAITEAFRRADRPLPPT